MNIKEIAKPIKSADDFLQGQRDCENGEIPPRVTSDDYDRGYQVAYELEQCLTEISLQLERIRSMRTWS